MAKQRVVEIKATRTRKDGKSKGTLKRVEQKDLIKEKVLIETYWNVNLQEL